MDVGLVWCAFNKSEVQVIVTDFLFDLSGIAADNLNMYIGITGRKSGQNFRQNILGKGCACSQAECSRKCIFQPVDIRPDIPFFPNKIFGCLQQIFPRSRQLHIVLLSGRKG